MLKGDFGVPHLLHGKSPDLFEDPQGTPLETYFVNVFVNVDGEFSSHYFLDCRMALLFLPPLLFRAIHLGPGWKGRTQDILGEGKHHQPKVS